MPARDPTVDVRDNPGVGRYEVRADDALAGSTRYTLAADRITFVHTSIRPEHAGAGLGSALARGALDDARARGLAVAPVCPFIAGFISRHADEYLGLVVPEMRARIAGMAR
jgi:uncharacterized protein